MKVTGSSLKVGNCVLYLGMIYEIIFNPFLNTLVLDSPCGQVTLNKDGMYVLSDRDSFNKMYENHGY